VLAPATVRDARGMLGPALADPDPVIIFEHGSLYNVADELPLGAADAVDISSAAIARPGSDVTLITYGGSLPTTLAAAEALATEGVSAEVIDLRVLRPFDSAVFLDSVRRTHRAVVVDENWRTLSIAGEIMAQVAEGAFYDLDAPMQRVCSMEVPMPYARHLELAAVPTVERVVEAARATMVGA
jgi:pyruvate dehydrogenase E1 component beta subunit